MAATQAEKQQQNDVNCEKVQPDQHLNVRNSLLQNGTDKSGVTRGGSGGGGALAKSKNTAGKNLEMSSQYRSEGGGGSVSGGGGGGGSGSSNSSGGGGAPTPEPDNDSTSAPTASDGYPVTEPPLSDSSYGYAYDGGVHAFGPRQPLVKPQQQQPPPQQSASGATTSTPFQPSHQHAGHGNQRFVSGQSISQPTGPTPTLNQLLQSSHPMTPHRYPNSYDQPYGQNWPPQKYGAPTGPQTPYRNQPAVSTLLL